MTAKSHLVELTGDKDSPTRDIVVESLGGDRYAVTVDGVRTEVEAFATDRGVALRRDGQSHDLRVERRGDVHVTHGAAGRQAFELVDARTHALRSALAGGAGVMKPELRSPMTGKVVLVRYAPGDAVEEGKTVVIIEAMKMENEIKAPGAAVIRSVRVAPGDLVAPGDVLVDFEL
ncbi:MAG: biotin/lipoyl-binding protein [Myxococcales bacterium]|nr:biotin/lipoyl-binding protein [Myxococcales bacterium]MCB9521103.1 biotin/lipoyl-binding protein [Myxococcales bacterium]MCB9534190.1 biotin/lipoyl-binding protein [Myxococcales bacterium]